MEEQHMAAETKANWCENGESRQLMEMRGTEPEGSGGPVWLSPTRRGVVGGSWGGFGVAISPGDGPEHGAVVSNVPAQGPTKSDSMK